MELNICLRFRRIEDGRTETVDCAGAGAVRRRIGVQLQPASLLLPVLVGRRPSNGLLSAGVSAAASVQRALHARTDAPPHVPNDVSADVPAHVWAVWADVLPAILPMPL
jgi:hypothetical protein